VSSTAVRQLRAAQGKINWGEVLSGYVLILPAVAITGLVIAIPVIQSFYGSVTRDGDFVGGDNFRIILTDPNFQRAFKNNLILLVNIPIRIALALTIAGLLYRKVFGSRLYETLIFMPFLPSVAAIGVLFIYLLSFAGPLNGLLRGVGFGSIAHGWLTENEWVMWTIMAVIVWTRVGFTVLLFTARMLSIDQERLQAAFVDGASWWKTFRYIVLPELKGTIEFVVLLSIIEAFSWSFSYVYVLGHGASDPNRWILEIYLYNKEFLASVAGLASAVSVILLCIAGALAVYRYARVKEVLE
jgi:raffinose/stachyose/melibiose transport system permease protein